MKFGNHVGMNWGTILNAWPSTDRQGQVHDVAAAMEVTRVVIRSKTACAQPEQSIVSPHAS